MVRVLWDAVAIDDLPQHLFISLTNIFQATVLEYTVQYLIHLKKHVGRQFDKDFMEKYSPY